MNVLVIAPHPDDEVLGCGGTIARLASTGHRVTVAIVTRGWAPLFSQQQVEQVRTEARQAAQLLGTAHLQFLDLPATALNELPAHKLNQLFKDLVQAVRPDWALLPFAWDRHDDHRRSFAAAAVALRPLPKVHSVSRIACYETPSETHWHSAGLERPFDPNWFVDIADHLQLKLQALKCYRSQLGPDAPAARSPEAVQALARWRGATVALPAAEAFVLVRDVWPAR